jgi:predicted RNA-binding Zn ribbon-like protein
MERRGRHVVRADQPLAIELASTIHAADDGVVDVLEDPDGLRTWLDANRDRLAGIRGLRRLDVRAALPAVRRLRDAGRALMAVAASGGRPAPADGAAGNEALRSAPGQVELRWKGSGRPAVVPAAAPDPLTELLALLALDLIDVLTGVHGEVQACGAPSCVLLFVRTHPRQAWCSPSCGNRARVARHYRRTRESN